MPAVTCQPRGQNSPTLPASWVARRQVIVAAPSNTMCLMSVPHSSRTRPDRARPWGTSVNHTGPIQNSGISTSIRTSALPAGEPSRTGTSSQHRWPSAR
jgi:hypothetical protein